MVPLYFDENLAEKEMARQLRRTGHLVYLAGEYVPEGADDPVQLEAATGRGAVLVTGDVSDFPGIHAEWQLFRRQHAGIVTCRAMGFGRRYTYLQRVARLLTPEAARNQLMYLDMFNTEELAVAYVISLTPATGTYT